MQLKFFKYHGNGNDFIMINNIEGDVNLDVNTISSLCHRRFGIGADGLILLNKSSEADFEMLYHNSDGRIASMCGNGGRCASAFAYVCGIALKKMKFMAYDGIHKATVNEVNKEMDNFHISLSMANVDNIEENAKYYFLDTGSPHYVEFVEHLAEMDVRKFGSITRNSESFHPDGTNVNFVEKREKDIFVRTYERGVEDETLSCGTGVTASAIAHGIREKLNSVNVHTIGGDFDVKFENNNGVFENIVLSGGVKMVFSGIINI